MNLVEGNAGASPDVVLDPAVQEILRGIGCVVGDQTTTGGNQTVEVSQNIGSENTAVDPEVVDRAAREHAGLLAAQDRAVQLQAAANRPTANRALPRLFVDEADAFQFWVRLTSYNPDDSADKPAEEKPADNQTSETKPADDNSDKDDPTTEKPAQE